MFEVRERWTIRGETHAAIPPSPAHDHDPAAADDRHHLFQAAGPYRVDAAPEAEPPRPLSRRRWRPRRVHLLLAAAALGLVLGAAEEAARRAGYAAELERVVRALGFGLDQVTLAGHRFSDDRDIFAALDLANVKTFAALDTAAVKARIERLPWIDTAELTRVFPGRLDIRVTERKPFALWSRADRRYLIDRTGRVLAAVGGDTLPDLPRFAGEGAAAEAAALLETLARYPDVGRLLAEAERVSERRWRLKLSNAATLELPVDGDVAALEALRRDAALGRLVAAGGATLDFRGPGRVAIRPAAGAGPAGAASAAGT